MWMHETGTFPPTQIPRSPVKTEAPVSQADSPVSQGSIPPFSQGSIPPFSQGSIPPVSQGSIPPVSTASSMPFSELTLFVVHEMYYLDMNDDDSNDYNNDVTLL